MSDTDSFIDEVSEEVRKEKLFATLRKYGWIGVLCVILLVGGAAWNEWRKAQERAEAEALGDAILSALERDDRASRASALSLIEAPEGAAEAVVGLLAAGERAPSDPRAAAEQLLALSEDPTVPNVYRQVAVLKAVTLPGSGLDIATRRERLTALVPGGGITRLLAEEQLALLLLEEGQRNAAIDRLQLLRIDAEITASMAQRVTQLIVALGAVPNDTASPLLPPNGGDTSSEALE
ncbi:MAG: hypothetical protein AAF686_07865 [Pseudomonadota bacterium]